VSDERRFGEHEARSPGPVFEVRTQWNLKHASHGEAAHSDEATRLDDPRGTAGETRRRSARKGATTTEVANPSARAKGGLQQRLQRWRPSPETKREKDATHPEGLLGGRSARALGVT